MTIVSYYETHYHYLKFFLTFKNNFILITIDDSLV